MARVVVGKYTDWFYKTKSWERCRSAYIAYRRGVDGGMCEICHENIGLIVHHKIHLDPGNMNDPDITLNHENLQLVCHHCHDVIHGYGNSQKKPSRVTFDMMGNPVPKSEGPPVFDPGFEKGRAHG